MIYSRVAVSMSLCLLQVISLAGVVCDLGYSDIGTTDYSDIILVKEVLEQWYPVDRGEFVLHVRYGRIICQPRRSSYFVPHFITSLWYGEINNGISEKKWDLILRRLDKFRKEGLLGQQTEESQPSPAEEQRARGFPARFFHTP
ncbi:hypothetical protein ES703_35100 [subsurface metagenome]